jgi:hypothetical protein
MKKSIRRMLLFSTSQKIICFFVALVIFSTLSYGQTANCPRPDPNKFDEVFACMSSMRFTGQAGGTNVFIRLAVTDCNSAAHLYASALQKSGVQPYQDAVSLVPSCEMLAKGMQELKGKAPYWSACTNYPGKFDPGHMKACLESFLPGYYGGQKTMASLAGCAEVTQQYEIALRSATVSKERSLLSSALPDGYEKPDCAVVASMFAGKGSACLEYQPTVAHLQKCLSADINRYPTCIEMRTAYESKVRQAYGGPFPPGYAALTCSQLSGLVADAVAAQAKLKADAAEAARRQAALQRQGSAKASSAIGTGSTGSLTGNGWIGWLWGYLGMPFLYGLIVHGIVAIGALIYASQKARTGQWIHVLSLVAGAFTRPFAVAMMAVHGILIAIGIFLTAWQWAVGAVAAILLGRLLAFVMWMFGLFKNPPVAVGRINPGGTVVRPPPATPAHDPSRAEDW